VQETSRGRAKSWNADICDIEKGESVHRKYKRLKYGGRQACDRSSDYAAVATRTAWIKVHLLCQSILTEALYTYPSCTLKLGMLYNRKEPDSWRLTDCVECEIVNIDGMYYYDRHKWQTHPLVKEGALIYKIPTVCLPVTNLVLGPRWDITHN
jgi:hypothetical protein